MNNSTQNHSNESFQWTDRYLLGYEPMDEVHREFVGIVASMQAATDAELPRLLDTFAHHARAHFDAENTWMTENEFPARDCHIDEHAAVMKSVDEVRELVATGNTEVCRRLVEELVKWFPSHADHLDSALAHWMCKKRLGGKPVVIKRGLTLR